MGGVASFVSSLFQMIGVQPPSWVMPLVVMMILAFVLPNTIASQRGDDALKLIRRASMERLTERERLEAEALNRVDKDAEGLLRVARDALERGRPRLAREALDRLKRTGKLPRETALMERMVGAEETSARTPEEAAIRIERALENGLPAEAQRLLGPARARWPEDPSWDELAARLPSDETKEA